jgi:hypothetical protein
MKVGFCKCRFTSGVTESDGQDVWFWKISAGEYEAETPLPSHCDPPAPRLRRDKKKRGAKIRKNPQKTTKHAGLVMQKSTKSPDESPVMSDRRRMIVTCRIENDGPFHSAALCLSIHFTAPFLRDCFYHDSEDVQ